MEDEKAPHVVLSWSVEVSDDFKSAHITLSAAGEPGNPNANGVYDMHPIWLEHSVLKRFHAELAGLLAYMEKGVTGPGTKN